MTSLDPLKIPTTYYELPFLMQNEYDRFISYLLNVMGLKPNTINTSFTHTISRYMLWLYEKKKVETTKGMGAAEAIEWVSQKTPGMKKAYIAKVLTTLRKFVQWQYLNGFVSSEEILKFDVSKPKLRNQQPKKVRALTQTEIADLFAHLNSKYPYDPKVVDRFNRGMTLGVGSGSMARFRRSLNGIQHTTMVLTVLELGVRVDELHRMTVADVDPRNDSVSVYGKGGKWRHIPYPESLKTQMKKWLAHRALLVPKHDQLWLSVRRLGEPLSYKGMRYKGEQIMPDSIGTDGWHILRKTFATVSYNDGRGLPINILAAILGHAQISTTQIYLGLGQSRINEEAKNNEQHRADWIAKAVQKGKDESRRAS